MLKCNHTWDFFYPDNELSLCSRKKTICLQVLVKTFREPFIKVLRELWMAAYSREDFRLASSERLISLGVGRHSLKLCIPHFSYPSKCCAFKKCKMIVSKSAIGLKPHATIPQLCVLPSTCIMCHFKLWIVEDLTMSISGKSLRVCSWDCIELFHLVPTGSLRFFLCPPHAAI